MKKKNRAQNIYSWSNGEHFCDDEQFLRLFKKHSKWMCECGPKMVQIGLKTDHGCPNSIQSALFIIGLKENIVLLLLPSST